MNCLFWGSTCNYNIRWENQFGNKTWERRSHGRSAKNNQGRISTLPQLGHSSSTCYLLDVSILGRQRWFRGWSFIFLLENELLAKHREGVVSLTHSYCFFDLSIPIYELGIGIQFCILRTNLSTRILAPSCGFPCRMNYKKMECLWEQNVERSFPKSIDSSQVVDEDLVFVLSPTWIE